LSPLIINAPMWGILRQVSTCRTQPEPLLVDKKTPSSVPT